MSIFSKPLPESAPFWNKSKTELFQAGSKRVDDFCQLNGIPTTPMTALVPAKWHFDACAYYRPGTGIKICLEKCASPAREQAVRNWNWPGNTTDREPYGVLCHELGHHCDWLASGKKGSYFGDYSIGIMARSKEPPLTSYCPNPAEWFAEHFRLFVTNPGLLQQLRTRTFVLLLEKWKPLPGNWREVLGEDVPERIIKNLRKKGAK